MKNIIVSLVFVGFMAINALGLSLSYLIPWSVKKYKTESNYFTAFLLITEKETRNQCLGHRQTEEINHTKGIAYLDIPQDCYFFEYKNFLKIEQFIDQKGLHLHVTWTDEEMERAISFLDLIKMRIDPHYKS